jgi:hypothetical protein
VIGAIVEELYSGAWVANTVDTKASTGSFNLGDGRGTWVGTTLTETQDGGRYYATIVGGKGKLSDQISDLWYNGTNMADTIATDAISQGGEELGSSSLGVRIDAWQRKAGTLGQALSSLVAVTGGLWWIGRDGKVNVALGRTGTEVDPATVSIASTDSDGSFLLNPLTSATIAPGMTWKGQTIKHVRWSLTPGNLTAAIAFAELPAPALTFDYFRTYSARVDRQNSDGTLDVIVDAKFGVSSVKWLSGLPAKVEISGGDLVTLGWLGGDPRFPYAQGLEQTSGTKAAAGKGDAVGYLCVGTIPAGPAAGANTQIKWFTDEALADAYVTAGVAVGMVKISLAITSGFERIKW